MNILFLTLSKIENINQSGIYTDLLREFQKNGDNVYIISPVQKRENKSIEIIKNENVQILRLKIGNITKCNIIEKGISTITIEGRFIKGIKKYFNDVKFDLVLYSTPPITFCNAIYYVKKRDNAFTYLMLKDIFPQNSVDLGLLSKGGLKGFIYKYFRMKERKLYEISDKIGCMSQANCDYILKHNPEIPKEKVGLCPNSIEPVNMQIGQFEKDEIRRKYNLPTDKKIFVYGGNLGKPQDVTFVIECIRACADLNDAFFAVAGSGTDRHFLEEFINNEMPSNVKLFGQIPKVEYDKMIPCCDAGLIFLDHRFTIPNFPSRLLAYMHAGLPVIACTDNSTDIGETICDGGFGFWCESVEPNEFKELIEKSLKLDLKQMGEKSYNYLLENFTVDKSCKAIISSLKATPQKEKVTV